MTTKAEADKMLRNIKVARAQLESAADALSDARDVLRDAASLIDAMADEMAEAREEA